MNEFRKNLVFILIIIAGFISLSYLLRNPSEWSKNLQIEKAPNSWEFCEGDFRMGENCTEKNKWKSVSFPGNIPLSSKEVRNIWIRFLIPNKMKADYKDYALYLALNYPLEIFIDDNKIFSFGEFRPDGTAPFNGFNHAHFVRLLENPSGKYLYIRLYSDWTRTEVIYQPLLGNYSDLVLHEFISQIDILVISIFYLVFGFFALIIYRKESNFKSFLYLGLISLFSGAGGIYLAEFKKHIYDAPLLYSQIFMPCLFALGPTLHLYVISIFGKGYKSSFQITLYLYIPILIFSIFLAYLTNRSVYYYLETFFAILSTFGILNILFHLIYYVHQGNKFATYFSFSFASLAGSLSSFSLYILGVTSYYGNTYLLGYFGFFIGMVFASGEEYFQSRKKLEEYSKNLEKIILEKTVQIEKKNKALFEEEKKIINLEKQNAINKERESIFADIHDNLGGKLLDLSIQLNNIQLNRPIRLDVKAKISERINEVLKGLRNRLLAFEDMEKIEENFLEGMQNFLIRRYSLVNRKIQFEANSDFQTLCIDKSICIQLLNIFQELVNNDLKYGVGKTIWKLSLADNMLFLQLQSITVWENKQFSSGNGHKTIQSRVDILNGKYLQQINNGEYQAELKIPIDSD
ncbi:MAG: hypothetical protein KBF93_23015 [Leptospiraceae bacterium]|nr:hypothetical protein [Leptospiraceae bacterium]